MAKSWEDMASKEKLEYLLTKVNGLEVSLANLIFDTRLARRVEEQGATLRKMATEVLELRKHLARVDA